MKLPFKSTILIFVTIILTTILFIASLLGNFILGAIAGVGAAITAILFFVSAQSYLFGNSIFINTTTRGKSPYTTSPCQPEENLTNSLAQMLAELKQAIQNKSIKIKSNEANNYERKANIAQKNKNYSNAIKNYALSINILMKEIKNINR
jgi:hypothetical protein